MIYVMIKFIAEGLQINISGINHTAQHIERSRIYITIGNQDIPYIPLVRQNCRIIGIFKKSNRFVICISDSRTIVSTTVIDHFQRHYFGCRHPIGIYLRYIRILTVCASEITARSAQRQTADSRMKMQQRLLFYRIDIKCARPPIDIRMYSAILTEAITADAILLFMESTMMRTKITYDTFVCGMI